MVKKWKGIRYKKFEPTLFPEASLTMKKDEDDSQVRGYYGYQSYKDT